MWPGSVVVRTAEEARDAADRLASGGADFIKVYDNLLPESYFALLEQARHHGIPVDGHLPWLVRPERAAAAGQRTFEHTTGISMGCSAEADAVRTAYRGHLQAMPGAGGPDELAAYVALSRQLMETRDPQLCEATARILREHGVAAVPTLIVTAGLDAQAFVSDTERMTLLPPAIRSAWREMAAFPDPFASLGALAHTVTDNVRVLNEAGVVILAGTDVGNPFLVPGLSLHRELVRLNEAGLSPLEALQAATLLPARVLKLSDSLGTVDAGAVADLVLLDANPLESITNTQRIRAVITNGRLLRRADLDQLLADDADLDPPPLQPGAPDPGAAAPESFERVAQTFQQRYTGGGENCPAIMAAVADDVILVENGQHWGLAQLVNFCPHLPRKNVTTSWSDRTLLGPDLGYDFVALTYENESGEIHSETTVRIWRHDTGGWKVARMSSVLR